MIIDVNKLKQRGETETRFSFVCITERQLLSLPGAEIPDGITVSGKAELKGKKLLVNGVVSYVITGECSRCLSPARAAVSEEFIAEYSEAADAEFPIKAGLADLTVPVEETVITSSPSVIYCRENCKGICVGCGVNLNESEWKCKNE
ncbi:MAG: DUF177 domain-containing protein [Clostridia bacterium]|nr:DUF177 domain-containing protein [Clostridia bacterium]